VGESLSNVFYTALGDIGPEAVLAHHDKHGKSLPALSEALRSVVSTKPRLAKFDETLGGYRRPREGEVMSELRRHMGVNTYFASKLCFDASAAERFGIQYCLAMTGRVGDCAAWGVDGATPCAGHGGAHVAGIRNNIFGRRDGVSVGSGDGGFRAWCVMGKYCQVGEGLG